MAVPLLTAASQTETAKIFPIQPTIDAIDVAVKQADAAHCYTSECAALRTINGLMGVMLSGSATSMGAARPIPANRDRVAEKRLDDLLLDHPDRYAPVCSAAKQILGRYGDIGTHGDLLVAVGLIELAARMDLRRSDGCLPALISVLPHTQTADQAIANAKTLCENQLGHRLDCGSMRR